MNEVEAGTRHKAVLWAIAISLLTVKVILIPAGGTGLRAEDFLIAVAFAALLLGNAFRNYRWDRIDRAILLFVAVQVCSALVSSAQGRTGFVVALLYAVRPLEYWVIKVLAQTARPTHRAVAVIASAYVFVLVGLSTLQVAGFNIGVSRFAYTRAAGNTNGPYELAAVAAGLLFFFLHRRQLTHVLLALASLLLSASRITTVAVLLVFLLSPRDRTQGSAGLAKGPVAAVAAFVFALTALLGIQGQLTSAASRVQSLSPVATLSVVRDLTASDPVARSRADFTDLGYTRFQRGRLVTGEADTSSVIRFTRWTTLVKAWGASTGTVLLGLGPSFGGVAVDGYYVRVLSESGLLGLGAFAVLVVALLRERAVPRYLRQYIVVLLISALFIDVLVASKPMLLLWFLLGSWQSRNAVADAGDPK